MTPDLLSNLDAMMAQLRERLLTETQLTPDQVQARADEIGSAIASQQSGIVGNTLAELGHRLNRKQVTAQERKAAQSIGAPHGLRRLFPGLK